MKRKYGKKVQKQFYLRDCVIVAKDLIGKILVRKKGKRTYSGIIVETEAYKGSLDAASHSFNGKSKRNEIMFEEGGVCYVYFTYGNHYCMNAVTDVKGTAYAVLIRALEPVDGIDYMKKNRNTKNIYNLTNGPGKLTKAFEIDKRLNGESLRSNNLYICESPGEKSYKISVSKRIGISKNKDKLWRFSETGSLFVSGVNVRSLLKKQNNIKIN